MPLLRRPLLAVLAGTMLLAGCTTTSSGDPAPASTPPDTGTGESGPPSTTESSEVPFAGAPRITDQLDKTTFQQDPCRTFTPAQTKQLNVSATGHPIYSPLGKACEWTNEQTHGYAQIRFNDKNPYGLSGEYQANAQDKFVYFDELAPIEGYPAVSNDIADHRKDGVCTVIVGVTDELTFETNLQLSDANVGKLNPCTKTAEVAGLALQTMKGA
jgi:Protein of unknown function (DUF3558)